MRGPIPVPMVVVWLAKGAIIHGRVGATSCPFIALWAGRLTVGSTRLDQRLVDQILDVIWKKVGEASSDVGQGLVELGPLGLGNVGLQLAVPRHAAAHGLTMFRPHPVKPPTSRVAIAAPAASVVAAMSASNASIGAPASRRAVTSLA